MWFGSSTHARYRVLGSLAVSTVGLLSICATLWVGRFERIFGLILGVLPGRDVTAHFLLMGTACFLAVLGFRGTRGSGDRLRGFQVTLFLMVLSTVDELLQLWLPNRTFSVSDLMANYAGMLFGGLLAAKAKGRARRQ